MKDKVLIMDVLKEDNPSVEILVYELQEKIALLSERLQPALLELKHREHGYLFSHVRPYSAKDTLGEGLLNKLKNVMPSIDIFLNSEKDGLKPFDIMLAGIYSNESHNIKKGKRITINITAGDTTYNGTHTALYVDSHNIVIPIAKSGDACGKYQNTEKVQNAKYKVTSIDKRIEELQDQITSLKAPKEEPKIFSINGDQEKESFAFEGKTNTEKEPKRKHFSAMQIVVGTILVAGVVTAVYFATADNSEKAAA